MVAFGRELHPQIEKGMWAVLVPKEKTTEIVFSLTRRNGDPVDPDGALRRLQGLIREFGYEGVIQLRKRSDGKFICYDSPQTREYFFSQVWDVTKGLITMAGYSHKIESM